MDCVANIVFSEIIHFDCFIAIHKETIIERTKPKLFRINIELTLFLELTMNTSEIQKTFIGSKYKIKNL